MILGCGRKVCRCQRAVTRHVLQFPFNYENEIWKESMQTLQQRANACAASHHAFRAAPGKAKKISSKDARQ